MCWDSPSPPLINTKANRIAPKYNPSLPKNHNLFFHSAPDPPAPPESPAFNTNIWKKNKISNYGRKSRRRSSRMGWDGMLWIATGSSFLGRCVVGDCMWMRTRADEMNERKTDAADSSDKVLRIRRILSIALSRKGIFLQGLAKFRNYRYSQVVVFPVCLWKDLWLLSNRNFRRQLAPGFVAIKLERRRSTVVHSSRTAEILRYYGTTTALTFWGWHPLTRLKGILPLFALRLFTVKKKWITGGSRGRAATFFTSSA